MAATNPRLGTMAAIRGGMETDPALTARIAAPTAFRSASRSSSDSTSARLTTNMSRLYGQAPGGDGAPGRSGPGQPRPFLENGQPGPTGCGTADGIGAGLVCQAATANPATRTAFMITALYDVGEVGHQAATRATALCSSCSRTSLGCRGPGLRRSGSP